MKFHVANLLLESWLGETEATLTKHNHRLPITHFLSEESLKAFSQEFETAIMIGVNYVQGYGIHKPEALAANSPAGAH